MKNIVLLVVFLPMYFNTFGQDKYGLTTVHENLTEVLNYKKDTIIKVYKIDNKSFDSLLSYSEKKYKILIPYAYWCHGCQDLISKIIPLYTEKSDLLDLFLITFDQYNRIDFLKYYLKKSKVFFPTYIVDRSVYTKNKNKRYETFIKEVCPKCKVDKMGYGEIIIYNKNNHIIYFSTYNIPTEEIIKKINSLN